MEYFPKRRTQRSHITFVNWFQIKQTFYNEYIVSLAILALYSRYIVNLLLAIYHYSKYDI